MIVSEGVEMPDSDNKSYLGGGLRLASGSAAPLRLDHSFFENEVRPLLGSILLQKGWITHERLDSALEEVKVTGMRLGETLLRRGWLFEPELAAALAEQAGLRYVDLVRHPLDPKAAAMLPLEVVRRMFVVPVRFWKTVGSRWQSATRPTSTWRGSNGCSDGTSSLWSASAPPFRTPGASRADSTT
jgi:GSPII_E N-terminal domain.